MQHCLLGWHRAAHPFGHLLADQIIRNRLRFVEMPGFVQFRQIGHCGRVHKWATNEEHRICQGEKHSLNMRLDVRKNSD